MSENKLNVLAEIDAMGNEKKALELANNVYKNILINEIKNGLGEQIKQNPNTFTVVKLSRIQRFKRWFKKWFLRF
jgi:hypothetical protein